MRSGESDLRLFVEQFFSKGKLVFLDIYLDRDCRLVWIDVKIQR